ncbi:hypothetical protein [Lysobacter gummosus]|uniref:hypothetical protein n=1 Tax=Lysobacter gummosus TaxID=262324 RepID=UPI00363527F3
MQASGDRGDATAVAVRSSAVEIVWGSGLPGSAVGHASAERRASVLKGPPTKIAPGLTWARHKTLGRV